MQWDAIRIECGVPMVVMLGTGQWADACNDLSRGAALGHVDKDEWDRRVAGINLAWPHRRG